MGGRNVDYSVLESILDGSKEPRHLPLEILTRITDNFSEDRKIGRGGFGDVYKGVLDDWTVAVKKITVNSYNIEREEKLFYREVECLLKIIEHRNVVRFLGFYSNTHHEAKKITGAEKRSLVQITERLLCFEYISSGSLEKHITDELRGLEWNIRYQLIKGICDGLQYLHNEMGIIHMDLKLTNIMVDTDNMVPKITDFGLARLVENNYTTGIPFFSRGYCAPEYMNVPKPTLECDIYSLGIIIREIVTGRNEMPNKDHVIRRWRCRWRKSATYTPLHVQQITKCVEIAERCTQEDPKGRPSISHIIRDLNESANTNVNIPASNQIPSWDYGDMLGIEPLELRFAFELLNKEISKEVVLNNETDNWIAFNIKIPSWDYDDMLGIEPLELRFAFELNKEISKEVVLTNETGNCIAFNIKASRQLQYCTQPSKGIVLPRSKNIVNITLQAQGTTTLGSMPCADEFIVQSTKVVDGLTDEEITEDIFNEEAGKVVDEVNLTVVYDNRPEKPHADQSLEVNASVSKEATACSSSKDVRLNFRPIETTSATIQYKPSERAAVDIMTGAMGGLLPKLGKLLKGEHNLPEDLKEDVESLEEQLTDMHTALSNVPHEEMHMLDLQDKKWVNKVRNLSYDIEDKVDGFLISIEGSEPITDLDGFRSLIQKMLNRVRNVADRSKEIKLTTSVANNRPGRSTDVDPGMLDWYKDHKYLVGIDGPRDSLVEKLTGGDDHASKQKLKIISIFGEGGLGKTTLAKNVFDKLAANFVLKAFVPVGRNPDIQRLLKDIIFELDKKGNKYIHNAKRNEWQLIDVLREVLKNKRYLIVIDDIWDTKSWNIIKCGFIDNDNGSRVITTSRIFEVAVNSGEVCKLKPLSYDDSKDLFNTITGKSTSTDQLVEQSTKLILGKCGGLPLAIITLASLLVDKPVVDWPEVYKRIGFGLEDTTSRAENTKRLLLFSYNELPCHLKTCLLYLSIFPEDKEIDKNTLVWRWIAEGFVHEERGETLFKVGERYFNQLVNRSLIQPVEYTGKTYPGDDGQNLIRTFTIYACRVHDMVLDFICSIAEEENFVTVLAGDEQQQSSSQNNARILAVQMRAGLLEQHDLDIIIGKRKVTRSFNATNCNPMMPLHSLLPGFGVLRVLYLEGGIHFLSPSGGGFIDLVLRTIVGLSHLRYLGLHIFGLEELPTEIGDLRCLQILDLARSENLYALALPQSVTLLTKLMCLRCDVIGQLPAGMGSLTSLEELSLFGSHKALDGMDVGVLLKEVGKLTNLRVLHIWATVPTGSYGEWCDDGSILEPLNNLKKMEDLNIRDFSFEMKPNNRWQVYSPSRALRRLHLINSEQPVWINATLGNITYLCLIVNSAKLGDLNKLGSLPQLLSLILQTDKYFHDDVADGAFPKLRYLKTNYMLTYLQGAMPCLESLDLSVRMLGLVSYDFESMRHLPLLEKVKAAIDCWGCLKTVEAEAVMAAVKCAVDNHHNLPILDLRQHGECKDVYKFHQDQDLDNDDEENEMESSWEQNEDELDEDDEDDDRENEMHTNSEQTDDEINDGIDSGNEQTDDDV